MAKLNPVRHTEKNFKTLTTKGFVIVKDLYEKHCLANFCRNREVPMTSRIMTNNKNEPCGYRCILVK